VVVVDLEAALLAVLVAVVRSQSILVTQQLIQVAVEQVETHLLVEVAVQA
jgi:hypothetical protein